MAKAPKKPAAKAKAPRGSAPKLRPEFKTATFQEGVETLADLQPGMILEGVVTNVAAFGAFVDIGVHQDGLVHVSALANKFVKDPHEVVKPGQIVKVRVMDVDIKRQRIALTMRLNDTPGDAPRSNQPRPEGNQNRERSQRDRPPPQANRPQNRAPAPTGLFAIALEKAKQKK